MSHTIILEASSFAEALKGAQNYTQKNCIPDEPMSYIILNIIPKTKKLAVIACDGQGYYERKLPLILDKKNNRSVLSNKGSQICLSMKDAMTIGKFISVKSIGNVIIEIDDSGKEASAIRLSFPDGLTTVFASPKNLQIPDYNQIVAKAEKGKKCNPELKDVYMPVQEMMRASKVLPSKNGNFVRIFTTNGGMALMEYQEQDLEIRIIFMFSTKIAEAA